MALPANKRQLYITNINGNKLTLKNYGSTEKDMTDLCDFLNEFPGITLLDFSNSHFDAKALKHLATLKYITEVRSGNTIFRPSVMLSQMGELAELNISSNIIGPESAVRLSRMNDLIDLAPSYGAFFQDASEDQSLASNHLSSVNFID